MHPPCHRVPGTPNAMFTTCLHCTGSLGRNEAFESFPVGTRFAFDARLGRLWVVCRRCARWNLSPLEERWEAVEAMERRFRDTRLRVSTDEIGLARLLEGIDLIRIGEPQRPEMAAWRYGDTFGRRRRWALAGGIAAAAGGAAVVSGAVAAGATMVAILPLVQGLLLGSAIFHSGIAQRPLPHPDGSRFMPIGRARLVASDGPAGWAIVTGYAAKYTHADPKLFDRTWWEMAWRQEGKNEIGTLRLDGDEALPLLRRTLPRVNRAGARSSTVQEGVKLIDEVGGPSAMARWTAQQTRVWYRKATWGDLGDLHTFPAAARLAFEMALHEDTERRALEGELELLTAAWREAEAIAAIADRLLVPQAVEQRLTALKATGAPPPEPGPHRPP